MRFAGRWAALAFAYATAVQALPWLEPAQTSAGLVAMAGKSAKPAAAPGIRRGAFPLGLRRRQEQQQFPSNWCGFIGGSPDDVLSCAQSTTCVYYGTTVGCCDGGPLEDCPDLYTSCVDDSVACDEACSANSKILKCRGEDNLYCGTYRFAHDFVKYQCATGAPVSATVQLVRDHYAASAPSSTPAASPVVAAPLLVADPTRNAIQTDKPNHKAPVSVVTVGGIIGGVLLALIVGSTAVCIWYCRRRRANRLSTRGIQLKDDPSIDGSQPESQMYGGPSTILSARAASTRGHGKSDPRRAPPSILITTANDSPPSSPRPKYPLG